MPTVTQILNRRRAPRADEHFTGTIAGNGPPYPVTLDPSGETTYAVNLGTTTYAQGSRVLLVATPLGNFILGSLPVITGVDAQ